MVYGEIQIQDPDGWPLARATGQIRPGWKRPVAGGALAGAAAPRRSSIRGFLCPELEADVFSASPDLAECLR